MIRKKSYCTKTQLTKIYERNPTPKDKSHCVHPAVSALVWELKEAHLKKRAPKYDTITFAQIERRIAAKRADNPSLPPILTATNLSAVAEADDRFTWWLQSDKVRGKAPEMAVDAGKEAEDAEDAEEDKDEDADAEYEDEDDAMGGEEDDEDEDDEEQEEEEGEQEVPVTGTPKQCSFILTI